MGLLRKLFSPLSRSASDAQDVEKELQEEWLLEREELTAEERGNFDKVVTYLAQLSTLERKAATDIFDIFVSIRLLLLQHLHKLSNISMEVRRNKHFTHDDRRQFFKEMSEYHKYMKSTITDIFQRVTSSESSNISLTQHFEGLATQTRELCNMTRASKKAALYTRSAEKSVKAAASSDRVEFARLLHQYGEKLMIELVDIEATVKRALVILHKDKERTLHYADHTRELLNRAAFSKDIGENLVREFHATAHYISKNLEDEVEKQRIELSAAAQEEPKAA